jgi:hypothetical protein
MSEMPKPIILSFIVCRVLTQDRRTDEYSVVGIVNRYMMTRFPETVTLSVFAELADCQADFSARFELRDNFDALVQEFPFRNPVKAPPQPLDTLFLMGFDYRVGFPRPGRYDFVLLIEGEEVARRKILVTPPPAPPKPPPPRD